MIDRDELKSKTGSIAEDYLVSYFNSKGYKATKNDDPLDQLHDIFIDGLGYQIKCQMPWILRQAITFTWANFEKYLVNKVPIIVLTTRRKYAIETHYLGGRMFGMNFYNLKYTKEHSQYSEKVESKAVIPMFNNPGLVEFADRIPNDVLDQLEETSVSRLGI